MDSLNNSRRTIIIIWTQLINHDNDVTVDYHGDKIGSGVKNNVNEKNSRKW